MVPLPDGSRHRVPLTEFAELLAMDPDLAALDAAVQVVLAVPDAGARGLDLPRTAAARIGRKVWANDGDAGLFRDPETGRDRIAAIDGRSPGAQSGRLGNWLLSGPDDLGPEGARDGRIRTITGEPVPDSEIRSVTIADAGRSIGRAIFNKADLRSREPFYRHFARMDQTVRVDPVTGKLIGKPERVPWAGRKPYFLHLHALPNRMDFEAGGPKPHKVGGDQSGGSSGGDRACGGWPPTPRSCCWAAGSTWPRTVPRRRAGSAPHPSQPIR